MRFAEFCAGIGGFRLGLELNELGWQCVYTNEIDEKCAETYRLNFNEGFSSTDIFSVDPNQLPEFDIMCAGFPCQPFSIAGNGLGFEDPRGKVFFKLLEIMERVHPPVVFLENVPNMIRHNKGKTFLVMKEKIEQMGYVVYQKVLDSTFFGVPQSRPRVYIVAFRSDLDPLLFEFTERQTEKTPFRPFINTGDFSIPISERWHEYIDLYTGRRSLSEMSFDVPKTRESLERIGPNVDLNNCVFQIRSSGIRAISIDEPMPTFAVSHSGGGAMIPVYSLERRHLNLTEMKRIMGFPEWFEFNVSRTDAIKQLANAVCPPVITSVGLDITRALT